MPRKTPPAKPTTTVRKTTSTPVRNSAVPKTKTSLKKAIAVTQEMIAERAYFIALSGTGASELDNWHRAERELGGSL